MGPGFILLPVLSALSSFVDAVPHLVQLSHCRWVKCECLASATSSDLLNPCALANAVPVAKALSRRVEF